MNALIDLPTLPPRPLQFLGPDATPAALVRATVANHAALFTDGPEHNGKEVHREDGVTWVYTPGDGEITVAFPRLPGRESGAALDALVASWRHRAPRRIAIWSREPTRPADLGARVAARGFEWGWKPHWMALDLSRACAPFPVPDGLRITVESGEPDWDVDDLPFYSRREPLAERLPASGPRRKWHFGAWLDGRIVGHSTLFLTTGRRGVAGIYDVGVVPGARNRGVGRAVSLAACQYARALGCHWATLNAATHIYERLGFVSLGRGQTWFMHAAALAAPPPAPAQVAFAEAVGRDDVRALDSLDREGGLPPDLDRDLPCGMAPLALAARVGKAVAARWLTARGATLDLRHAWDLGWRAQIPGLLAETPDLVNRPSGPLRLTPLHEAVRRDDADLARQVLAAGPDLTARDAEFNGTPLDWARHYGRAEIVALIERHQAARPEAP